MKKVLFLGLVLSAFALGSCSKTYTCDYGSGASYTYDSKDYTNLQMQAIESSCKSSGGDWSSN